MIIHTTGYLWQTSLHTFLPSHISHHLDPPPLFTKPSVYYYSTSSSLSSFRSPISKRILNFLPVSMFPSPAPDPFSHLARPTPPWSREANHVETSPLPATLLNHTTTCIHKPSLLPPRTADHAVPEPDPTTLPLLGLPKPEPQDPPSSLSVLNY
jgi:hypothetical protein